ncbi:hypothetical protein O9993_02685 [Vibrio lentus]|nr:hypothetical protein [Vibrio lentus]
MTCLVVAIRCVTISQSTALLVMATRCCSSSRTNVSFQATDDPVKMDNGCAGFFTDEELTRRQRCDSH